MCSLNKKALLPWNICDARENEQIFTNFFNYAMFARIAIAISLLADTLPKMFKPLHNLNLLQLAR